MTHISINFYLKSCWTRLGRNIHNLYYLFIRAFSLLSSVDRDPHPVDADADSELSLRYVPVDTGISLIIKVMRNINYCSESDLVDTPRLCCAPSELPGFHSDADPDPT
jgi:hypothetical protein